MEKQQKIVYNNTTEEECIKNNVGLVVFLANRFRPNNLSHQQWELLRDEYIQVGQLGLLKAIRAYDPTRSKSLTTSAWTCIRNEILRFIQSESRNSHINITYSIPTHAPEFLWESLPVSLSDTEHDVLKYRCQGYTYKEIGQLLGYSTSWVNQNLKKAIVKIKQSNAT